MAQREELILDITAKLDQALKDVASLQEQVEKLAQPTEVEVTANVEGAEQVEELATTTAELDGTEADVTLGADDEASDVVEDVTDAVDDLDGTSAEVELEADDEATDAVEDVESAVDDLDGTTATVEVEADTEEAVGGLGDVDSAIGDLLTSGAALKTLFGAAAGGALAGIVATSAEATLGIQGLADITGSTLERASGLAEQFDFVGVSVEKLQTMIGRAGEAIAATPELAARLNVSPSLPPLEQFVAAIDALNSGQIDAAERIQLSTDLFGRRGIVAVNAIGTQIGNLSTAINDIPEWQVVTEEDVTAAIEAKEAMDQLGDAVTEAAQKAVTLLGPAIRGIKIAMEELPGEFDIPGVDLGDLFSNANAIDTFLRKFAESEEVVRAAREAIEANRLSIEDWNAAAADGTVTMQELNAATTDTEDAVSGLDDEATSVIPSLDSINAALTDLLSPAERFPDLWGRIVDDLGDGRADLEATAAGLALLSEATGKSVDELLQLAKTDAGPALAATAVSVEEIAEATNEWSRTAKGMERMPAQWEAMAGAAHRLAEGQQLTNEEMILAQELADAYGISIDEVLTRGLRLWDQNTAAAQRLADAIHAAGVEMGTTESRAQGIAGAFDTLNDSTALSMTNTEETLGFVNNMTDAIDALGKVDLSQSDLITSDWNQLLDEDLAGAVTAVGNLRESVQSEMGQAFAAEGPEGMRAWAASIREGLTATLTAAGFTSDEITEVLEALGATEAQVEVTIELAQKEQTIEALHSVLAAIEGIPPTTRFDIEAALNGGDPAAAVALINGYLLSIGAEPIQVDYVADDGGTVDDFATAADEAAEERNPQFVVPKSDSLGQMETLLNAVARNRIVQFIAKADNAGAIDAILNHVARFREQHTYATVDARNAFRTLDLLDDPRTVHVNVVTHGVAAAAGAVGSIPGVNAAAAPTATGYAAPTATYSSGGGGAVTMLAAPAPVTNNVTIQAGVIGNRFDVQRAVSRALRQSQRLNGTRN